MSREEICMKWLENRTINPRTGRSIDVEGPTYKALQEECAEFIQALPTRDKDALLIPLAGECFNDEDPITLDKFSDLTENELGRIIKIGTGSKKHCIGLENIYSLIKERVDRGMIPRNPFTREDISVEDTIKVYTAMKRAPLIDEELRDIYVAYGIRRRIPSELLFDTIIGKTNI